MNASSSSKRTLSLTLILVAAIAGATLLSACNTTEGFGEDVKSLGKGIEESASDNK